MAKWQSAGGRATGVLLREAAIAKYNSDPRVCGECNAVITVPEGAKVAEVRKKKFCDARCAARFNNRLRKKRSGDPRVSYSATGPCESCGATLEFRRCKHRSHGFHRRRYCKNCRARASSGSGTLVPEFTKRQIFDRRSSWQSARSSIRRHAVAVFAVSGRPAVCAVCGYAKHIQIAHIKAVSEFGDNATIAEINASENLVALCPNHHWEFDHGALDPVAAVLVSGNLAIAARA
jgi:hypothetical protein